MDAITHITETRCKNAKRLERRDNEESQNSKMKKTPEQFFEVSHAIEDVFDEEETQKMVELFKESIIMKGRTYENTMYRVHSMMGHLKSHCTPGVLRDYDVFVRGKVCMRSEHIASNLRIIFDAWENGKKTDNFDRIKSEHVSFEKIHPFGDGNGRVGRFLMLVQATRNKVEIPDMFYDMDNYLENREEYYRWFR